MTQPRCPRCEFSYAWDGHNCTHCHLPTPARASWASFAALRMLEHAHPNRDRRKAMLVGCAFARRVAHLLAPVAVAALERAEASADGETAGLGDVLNALRIRLGDQSAVLDGNDPAAWAGRAVLLAGRMCPRADDDVEFREVAGAARAAAVWAAFPERAWNSFPLPPALEPIRPTLHARPSHDEHMSYRRDAPKRYRAIQELNRASGEHETRRASRERDEESAQCRLYREVYGYPFVTIPFEAAWRTSAVLGLARQMYETRDFTAMPILADALQEAGCDNDEILDHCRKESDHVRGCWVADLVLKNV